jgi:uncharacterized protein
MSINLMNYKARIYVILLYCISLFISSSVQSFMKHHISLLILLTISAYSVNAQSISGESEVTVPGSGSVQLEPDYVTVSIGVTVQDKRADAAAARMSELVDAVTDTLVALGTPRGELPSTHFNISTVRNRSPAREIVGYSAAVTFELRTDDLDNVAVFIGAAIDAGATDIGRVQYGSYKAAEAHTEALKLAVAAATEDARTIAEATGRQLGPLKNVTMSGFRTGVVLAESAVQYERPLISKAALTPQNITVSASVSATWSLLSGN